MHAPERSWKQLAPPALLAGVAALAVVASPLLAAGVALAGGLVLFTVRPMLGWVLVVLTYPFIYLQLFLGRTINVPYVDALAALCALGFIVRLALQWIRTGTRPALGRLPGLLPFALFIGAAALSLTNSDDLGEGVKFLFRPLTFFYAMFVALPAIILDRPSRLFTTFRAMFAVGLVAAAMGAWSFLMPPETMALRRAVPIAFAGIAPLGTNHNLIAEVLVSIIPIGVILARFAHDAVRRWYVVGTIAFGVVTLLTLSRNGWLTLAMEGLILVIATARLRGVSWKRMVLSAGGVAAVALLAVGLFSRTAVARSSNENRLRLTAIALEQFRDHPFVGAGVGTFQEAVARDRWYIADFGAPQEAHGLVQKLLAETGMLGLVTFVALLAALMRAIVRAYHRAAPSPEWQFILLALVTSAAGSIVFQLFNTSYFVSKLWLPLGIAIAAARLAERGIALRTGRA